MQRTVAKLKRPFGNLHYEVTGSGPALLRRMTLAVEMRVNFDLGGLASNSEASREVAEHMMELYFERAVDDGLRQRMAAMTAASLLREALWSMVSEETSAIGFDYRAYTSENLRRFNAAYLAFENLQA